MLKLDSYDVVIFDCDGVILDSNELKITAMKLALEAYSDNQQAIARSVEYFRANFGKSRYHHIAAFAEQFFELTGAESAQFEARILNDYAQSCEQLYLQASLTPAIDELLEKLNGKKLYVASGSDQDELRRVFARRKLHQHFVEILGSPTQKKDNVRQIIEENGNSQTLMIGDAVSDFSAAAENGIDFLFYSPFSNVKDKMLEMSKEHDFPVINHFSELL
ncbi:HAD-IA family hydrolase [Pseudoalteromonas sp. OOF1S-7]|uniref:HAD family hydrolase n=1 Tax=Pseudoalteromonas sp. OOF1S-7 TaxID=2917757 RepID=UPI001EF68BC7|nr:HAD-IA family hydrolase [Pseudoalteromonas sp. OOF1S-7]MCG7536342.1 HAD-IA family hydrolase [Pseudoalteromonas sp. OOF1S-7]